MRARAVPTPKNPFGVAEGQLWESTDTRPERGGLSAWAGEYIAVLRVDRRTGRARVITVNDWSPEHVHARPRWIRLDRFTPKHHYRLIERKEVA